MPAESAAPLGLLSAMITPAVLISASGALILSTSMRLGRVVDRVRFLSDQIDRISAGEIVEFREERRAEAERQLQSHAVRGRTIQAALTSFYVAVAIFVGTTISTGFTVLVPAVGWVASGLGIVGTLVLFFGCMLLIRETRLAFASVRTEMEFVLRLRDLRKR
jgi:hypothetical protein